MRIDVEGPPIPSCPANSDQWPQQQVILTFANRVGQLGRLVMEVVVLTSMPLVVGAIGYSILYLVLGGGLGGAVLIFIAAKMLRH